MKDKLKIQVTTVSESPIWAPGLIYVSEEEKKILDQELEQLVKSFFDDFLDYEETHGLDENRVRPIQITCARAVMSDNLSKLLLRMRELSHK